MTKTRRSTIERSIFSVVAFPVAELFAAATRILTLHTTKTTVVAATTTLALSKPFLVGTQRMTINTVCTAIFTLAKYRCDSLVANVLNEVGTTLTRRTLLGLCDKQIFGSYSKNWYTMNIINNGMATSMTAAIDSEGRTLEPGELNFDKSALKRHSKFWNDSFAPWRAFLQLLKSTYISDRTVKGSCLYIASTTWVAPSTDCSCSVVTHRKRSRAPPYSWDFRMKPGAFLWD